jgi:hypothetical protein
MPVSIPQSLQLQDLRCPKQDPRKPLLPTGLNYKYGNAEIPSSGYTWLTGKLQLYKAVGASPNTQIYEIEAAPESLTVLKKAQLPFAFWMRNHLPLLQLLLLTFPHFLTSIVMNSW